MRFDRRPFNDIGKKNEPTFTHTQQAHPPMFWQISAWKALRHFELSTNNQKRDPSPIPSRITILLCESDMMKGFLIEKNIVMFYLTF